MMFQNMYITLLIVYVFSLSLIFSHRKCTLKEASSWILTQIGYGEICLV